MEVSRLLLKQNRFRIAVIFYGQSTMASPELIIYRLEKAMQDGLKAAILAGCAKDVERSAHFPAEVIRLVPDEISIKISHISRYFAKVPGKKYFTVLRIFLSI